MSSLTHHMKQQGTEHPPPLPSPQTRQSQLPWLRRFAPALLLTLPLVVPLAFFIIWEVLARNVGNDLILPPLEQIGLLLSQPGADVISMGSLAGNICISLVRVLCGYALAVAIGVPLGVGMGYWPALHRTLDTFLGMFRPIPPLAWVPLVLAWFGVASLATMIDLPRGPAYYYLNNLKLSMLFIIFIGAFFPVLTSAIHGVRTVNNTLIDAARVLGASRCDIFMKILLPAAAPSIVNGLRIGLGVAWMCLVSAEMLPGSLSGVGYLITHAYTVGRTDVVIAGMVSISVVGVLLDAGFQWLERHKYAWKQYAR